MTRKVTEHDINVLDLFRTQHFLILNSDWSEGCSTKTFYRRSLLCQCFVTHHTIVDYIPIIA